MHDVWRSVVRLGGKSSEPATVVVLDPSLPVDASHLLPDALKPEYAAWLPWSARAGLTYRSRQALTGDEVRIELPGHQDVVGLALGSAGLLFGVLATRVVSGDNAPWSRDTAALVSEVLAQNLLPTMAAALREERSLRDDAEVLRLQLERIGAGTDDVVFLGADIPDRGRQEFKGALSSDGRTSSYLGKTTRGSTLPGADILLMTSFSRFLMELPDPDPSTVIDAVHVDLISLLGNPEFAVDVTVVVPQPDHARVATTENAVVVVDSRGKIVAYVRPDGATIAGGVFVKRRTVEVEAPPGSWVCAVQGVRDPAELLRLVRQSEVVHGSHLAFALREQAGRYSDFGGSILVHAMPRR